MKICQIAWVRLVTTKQVEELRSAIESGCSIAGAARRIGIPRSTAQWWVKEKFGIYGLRRGRPAGQKWPYHSYRVYRRKTGRMVASGTAEQCAKQLCITVKYFYSLVGDARRGENGYIVETEEMADKMERYRKVDA